jgi:hypothetical protein
MGIGREAVKKKQLTPLRKYDAQEPVTWAMIR